MRPRRDAGRQTLRAGLREDEARAGGGQRQDHCRGGQHELVAAVWRPRR
jgi:hypothetical protein